MSIFGKMDSAKKQIYRILTNISRDAKLDKFIFFGGYPIDLLSEFSDKQETNDLDIAIPGIDTEQMDKYEAAVTKKGYLITAARRLYIIHRTDRVFTTFAQKGNIIIDANFMEDPTKVGLFNIDSLYFIFPSFTLEDKHGCLEGLKSKIITSIRGLENESPYFLAARFIYLSAKYGISMLDVKNRNVADGIVRNMNREPVDLRGEFNSFLSSVFKSILKSKERLDYLRELLELEVFKPRLYELEISAKNIIDKQLGYKIQNIKNANDLANLFLRNMPNRLKDDFYKKIEPLYHRYWEKDNRKLDSDLIEKL